MISSAFLTGFALGFSLILAIGAQNAFVLRQGLLKQHVLPVVLFCAVSDMILIVAGVGGVSLLIADFAARHAPTMFGLAAIWLGIYGLMRLRSAANAGQTISTGDASQVSLAAALTTAAVLTFGNPHVYLDTVVLVGTISLQFDGMEKIAYGAGAATASFVFFFSLGFGATLLAPQMHQKNAWRILDTLIALVMFALAYGMARAGGWVGG
ncbi:MAG TPA: lysine efflux permease, partial [Alphaproteobacteria bacterium]|jgi:L-lysine exporter family protein LysE/ArgO|nr:MAG: lysine efflux permease [SAR116 cluster bacterium MED-G06]HCV88947.1 lysine efflux permease [Alphaproteobacteria bacterium]|tara:strand:- start:4590 stop:5219 length:630 start_codon:yes stop_codon:yes gene_type:complete